MSEGTVKDLGRDRYYLGCTCGAPYCCIMFWHDTKDDDVSICPQLNHYLPWYKRLSHGIAFIFGMKPSRCHYGEIVVDLALLDDLVNRMSMARVDAMKRKANR